MTLLDVREVNEAQKVGVYLTAIERDASKHFSPVDNSDKAQSALRKDLLEKNVLPAFQKQDVPATSGEAARAMAGKDLGLPSDHGKSSATSVSRLLQASGLDVKVTPSVPDLKHQLEGKGYKAHEMKPGEKLKSGDVVFTSMDPAGRNVGIVGSDGKIYSHDHRAGKFVSHDQWTSKFKTVMRH